MQYSPSNAPAVGATIKMKLFKIKHRDLVLFSKGGSYVNDTESYYKDKQGNPTYYSWSKRGKTWTGLGPLKSHLRQYCEELRNYSVHNEDPTKPRRILKNNIPETWIVCEFDIATQTTKEYPAKDLYPPSTLIETA
jgi:hypothetical protein